MARTTSATKEDTADIRKVEPAVDTSDRTHAHDGFVLVLLGVLYFAQGLPLGFIFHAYPAILRSNGVALETIAFIPLLGLPWVFKFLWAPIVDDRWLQGIGRRRTWLLTMQILMIAAMAAVGFSHGTQGAIGPSIFFLLLASMASATQDIATDGLAAERLRGNALVHVNVLSVGGMMAGFLAGGAGLLLVVEHIGQAVSIYVLSGLLCACAMPVLVWREAQQDKAPASPRASILRTVKRAGFVPLLVVALLYAAAHNVEGALVKLFLVDSGWALTKVGAITATGSFAMMFLGCGSALRLVVRFGAWTATFIGLCLCATTIAYWVAVTSELIPLIEPVAYLLAAVSGAGLGLCAVAVFTITMRFAAHDNQTGTDVTAFKSGNGLGEILSGSMATLVAAQFGYPSGFALGLALALIAMLTVRAAAARHNGLAVDSVQPAAQGSGN